MALYTKLQPPTSVPKIEFGHTRWMSPSQVPHTVFEVLAQHILQRKLQASWILDYLHGDSRNGRIFIQLQVVPQLTASSLSQWVRHRFELNIRLRGENWQINYL